MINYQNATDYAIADVIIRAIFKKRKSKPKVYSKDFAQLANFVAEHEYKSQSFSHQHGLIVSKHPYPNFLASSGTNLFNCYTLIESSSFGDIIKGSGGIRKVRCKSSGHGKRGGARIIYYWASTQEQIFMLFAYAKNEATDLTKEQLSILKKTVVEEFKNEK